MMRYHLSISNSSLVGTGNYSGCRDALVPLLSPGDKQGSKIKTDAIECSKDLLHNLPINFTIMPFYGFSEFWYTMNDVLAIGGPYRKTSFDNHATVSVIMLQYKSASFLLDMFT